MADDKRVPVNRLLDGITFTGDPIPDDVMIVSALVVAQAQDIETGRSRVVLFRSEGIDDVAESGMLHIATLKDDMAWQAMYMPTVILADGDDDDDDD